MNLRRFLVLHLPLLATDRIRQREPELHGKPIATWDTQGNRRLLIGVDAPGTTLHSGQALADAQAMHPDLVLRPADPAADLAFLERLALWAVRFTPLAAMDAPDSLVLDVTGCADLFGGEAQLLRRAAISVERGGIAVRAVMAGISEAAAVLARSGMHERIVPAGEERALIANLPLATLRLPGNCVAGLHRLGLQRIGDVLRQPRAPLSRRFGRPLLDVLDAVMGDRPRVLTPVRPPPPFMTALSFIEPIVTRPAIDRALDTLLERLCQQLDEAAQGARRVTLLAFRVDRDVQTITIGTGLPTRKPAHLRRLFASKLETLEPDLGYDRITLQADVTNAMTGTQEAIAAGADVAGQKEALAQLIDRLSQRLPVWRLAPGASHWPERSIVRVGPFEQVPSAATVPGLPEPVRLLKPPVPLRTVSMAPDGAPVRLHLKGKMHKVAWADGPERIEPEWWHDAPDEAARDYYRVELDSGTRIWVYRSAALDPDRPAVWLMHGYLA